MPKPRGGSRHAAEIAQVWKQYARYQDLYEKKGCNQCKPCKKAAQAAGMTVGAYIIYRCIRMIPSLFPPF